MARKIEVPVGTRFGTWTTETEKFKNPGDTHYSIGVGCDCGVVRVMKAYTLTSGRAERCWECYNAERPKVLAPRQVLVNAVFGHYVKSARERGYSFDMTKTEVGFVIFQDCFYCGREPQNTLKDRRNNPVELPKYNGMDRIDNSEGYYLDNVHTCCRWCNEAKRAKSEQEFVDWIRGLVQNFERTEMILSK